MLFSIVFLSAKFEIRITFCSTDIQLSKSRKWITEISFRGRRSSEITVRQCLDYLFSLLSWAVLTAPVLSDIGPPLRGFK